ncbi:MAG: hypothetical protein IJT18_05305 [Oscillospiraceae bacterium]|nr:hypothetical protein [Oscillospiraceae bacterium]
MQSAKNLRRTFTAAILALLVAFMTVAVATFAWYVYNTNAHTTNVHMVAGAGVSLQISDKYEGPYSSAAVLDEFFGTLNPVSTDNILNGFQKVMGFTNGSDNQSMLVANLFGKSSDNDFYVTTLYFRTNGQPQDIYISDITFEDSDPRSPISSAIRVGFVAHKPGQNQPVDPGRSCIFSISDKKNPEKQYNTATGQEGYVLDSNRTDGTTVPFSPYTSANYCDYDRETGVTTLKANSVPLCRVAGSGNGTFGDRVQVDVYIWLEGCDEDCTANLSNMTLKNLALAFAAYEAN